MVVANIEDAQMACSAIAAIVPVTRGSGYRIVARRRHPLVGGDGGQKVSKPIIRWVAWASGRISFDERVAGLRSAQCTALSSDRVSESPFETGVPMRAVQSCSLLLAPLAALSLLSSPRAQAQDCGACFDAQVVAVGDTPFVGSATGCDLTQSPTGCALDSVNTNFFAFTPAQSGTYRISTCLSGPGEAVHVLSVSSSCENLSQLACAFEGCPGGGGSALIGRIELVAGNTYRIGVGALASFGAPVVERGVLSIDLLDPPGSGCADATVATVGLNAYDNSDRNEILELAGFCDPYPQGGPFDDSIYNAQYFKFTPPASDVYTISTCDQGEQVFERLAVFADCAPKSGVLACSNFSCVTGDTGSTILGVQLQAGVEYTLVIGGVLPGQLGAGAFTIAPFSACPAPTPTVVELEPCGADTNGGCNSNPNTAEPISVGDVVRGTMWANGGVRDTDWYALELTEGTEITIEISSNFYSRATFVLADCTSDRSDEAIGTCGARTDGECLPAGLYYIVVTPGDFYGFPCGYPTGNEYTLTVTGRPCDASPPPNDLCADAIVVPEGATPFDNLFAATDPASEESSCTLIGRDVWFSFTASETGNHKIYVCNTVDPFFAAMDIWSSCPDLGGEILACNDDAGEPDCGLPSLPAVIVPLEKGQTVRIRVGSQWSFGYLPPGAADLVVDFIDAQSDCGVPAAGSCCEPKSTPFCADILVCNRVCAFDPTCCSVAWDRFCAAEAIGIPDSACRLPPTNDACAEAVEAKVGANAFRNVDAGGSASTPCGSLQFDVWYTYEAVSDQPVTISFCEQDGGWALASGADTNLDTRIAVFASCGGLLVACSDDACGTPCSGSVFCQRGATISSCGDAPCNTAAKVTFTPACGVTYIIGVGSNPYENSIYGQGIGSFTITQSGTCGNGCPADIDGDGEVSSSDLGALLSAWGTAGADLDGDGETGSSDLGVLLSAWGACP
jgi:hypothetical protein